MSEQPTLELILSSPQVFTVTNFSAWVAQTPEFANSPIRTVHHFRSTGFRYPESKDTMSASEIVAALGYYGCEDLGPKLDVRSCGEHPEVITGKVPFSERRNDVALAHLIVNRKETPHRPSEHIPSDSKDGDAFWSLIISCWAYKPEERPSAKEARDIV
ncbi:unnamed protein product [Rhizoctonia solani]|uniref:Serine-threonine/tyrosine-protein kinase catalytic domain-containing protein n=1 Tax=Rhizoctonia solani TaxID=456999 RepID=A0A8H3D0X0_9AGAM|nr:unnamed protein product [Rhizoctonia solani]